MTIEGLREGGASDGTRGGRDFIEGDLDRPDVLKIVDRRLLQRYSKLEMASLYLPENREILWKNREQALNTYPAWAPMTQSQCVEPDEDGNPCGEELSPRVERCPKCGAEVPPSPQQMAWECDADVLLVGGSAGGGKTGLMNGTALMKAVNAGYMRQNATHLDSLFKKDWPFFTNKFKERAMNKGRWGFEEEGLFVTWSGLSTENDKKFIQGNPNDKNLIDEASQIEESYGRWATGWNRTTELDVITQILMGSNPPMNRQGAWLFRMFYRWVRREAHLRVPSGKKLYFLPSNLDDDNDEMRECEKDDTLDIRLPNGKVKEIKPKSFCFISMNVSDNYFLNDDYISNLAGLPPAMREKMLKGIWSPDYETQDYQVIPTEWVIAAQKRWSSTGWETRKQSALGVDVGRSDAGDRTCITPRHEDWFGRVVAIKGKDNNMDGRFVAERALREWRNPKAPIYIDASNIGASAFDFLKERIGENGKIFENGAHGMAADIYFTWKPWCRSQFTPMGFFNVRAMLWWRFRELLDPRNPHPIMLHPDDDVLSELTTPLYTTRGNVYIVEEKKDIKKRLNGQSTDKADSVILAAIGRSCPHKAIMRPFIEEVMPKTEAELQKERKEQQDVRIINPQRPNRSPFGGGWAI